MTQEDKELLLKDLCARLPYKVEVLLDLERQFDGGSTCTLTSIKLGETPIFNVDVTLHDCSIEEIRPYLRPMSSMTEEENAIFDNISNKDRGFEEDEDGWTRCDSIHTKWGVCPDGCAKLLDYLNSIHIDYRGLIEKGLAIEVTEENNPYK